MPVYSFELRLECIVTCFLSVALLEALALDSRAVYLGLAREGDGAEVWRRVASARCAGASGGGDGEPSAAAPPMPLASAAARSAARACASLESAW